MKRAETISWQKETKFDSCFYCKFKYNIIFDKYTFKSLSYGINQVDNCAYDNLHWYNFMPFLRITFHNSSCIKQSTVFVICRRDLIRSLYKLNNFHAFSLTTYDFFYSVHFASSKKTVCKRKQNLQVYCL